MSEPKANHATAIRSENSRLWHYQKPEAREGTCLCNRWISTCFYSDRETLIKEPDTQICRICEKRDKEETK